MAGITEVAGLALAVLTGRGRATSGEPVGFTPTSGALVTGVEDFKVVVFVVPVAVIVLGLGLSRAFCAPINGGSPGIGGLLTGTDGMVVVELAALALVVVVVELVLTPVVDPVVLALVAVLDFKVDGILGIVGLMGGIGGLLEVAEELTLVVAAVEVFTPDVAFWGSKGGVKGLALGEALLLTIEELLMVELVLPVVRIEVLAVAPEVVANLPGIARFFARRPAVVAGRTEDMPLPNIPAEVAALLAETPAVLFTIFVKMRWLGPSRCEEIAPAPVPPVVKVEGRGRVGIFPVWMPWPGGGIGPLLDERSEVLFPIVPPLPARGALAKLMEALNLESSVAVRGLLGTVAVIGFLVGLG